ncbi:MAG: tetratricopeptide repeat protein [Ignavibacteria bacterium]|nr:tetratricopeptide repeat protein [Ignavibacteria bacterium]
MSEFALALESYHDAHALFETVGSRDRMAGTLGNIGNMYLKLSEYSLAIEYLHQALTMDEELGRTTGIAANLGNIAIMYWNILEYDKAIVYLKKALAIYEELDNKEGIAINLGNIGVVYSDCGDYQLSLEYLQKTVAIFEKLGRKDGVAIFLGNIGNVYKELGDYSIALEYQQRALQLHQVLGRKEGITIAFGSIGALYSINDFEGYNITLAEEFLLKALAIDEEIGSKKQLYTHHHALAEIYKSTKRWEEFGIHFEKYHYIEKEVLSEDAKKQAHLLEQRRKTAERDKELAIAKAAADAKFTATEQLLHNVLPPTIAQRMLSGENLIAEKLTNVSVLFADIVEFTKLSGRITPEELVEGLDRIFSEFDRLAEIYGLEKIKTIGDAYMVVSGAPIPREDHAVAIVHFAVEMLESIKQFRAIATGEAIQVRIGIHSGDVVAGVIGKKKFAYDMWGDAVNTASRMESHGEAGKIHVSEEFMKQLFMVENEWLMVNGKLLLDEADEFSSLTIHHLPFTIIPRGELEIKGKGMMKTYFLEKHN